MSGLIKRVIYAALGHGTPYATDAPCGPRDDRIPYNSGDYNLRLIKADNGHIISMTLLDPGVIYHGPPKTYVRVCPEGSSVMDEIAAILATVKLGE